MEILSDHRITSILPSERELAQRAEWARISLERAPLRRTRRTRRSVRSLFERQPVTTASITTVPSH